jgi:hypothetical protein
MSDQPESEPDATIAPFALVQLATGYWLSQAIYVAAKVGIADLLAQGPRSAAQLAESVGAHPDSLHRILRALAGAGVFREDGDGRFALTPLAEHLRSDVPTTVRNYVIMLGSGWLWRAWGELLYSSQTGEPAFERVFGTQFFKYMAEHPDAARIFDVAMTSRSRQEDAAVAAAYNWPVGTVVDIGGGRGSQLAAILKRAPACRGILFDQPHVIPSAARLLDEAALAARCEVVAGDFFEGVPEQGDLYLLKKVIHDWDDERARKILVGCRTAMSPQARLLVIEHVLAPGNEPSWSKLLDLQMLVLTAGGRERSETEYATLLGSAGLALQRVIPTGAGVSLIEAATA